MVHRIGETKPDGRTEHPDFLHCNIMGVRDAKSVVEKIGLCKEGGVIQNLAKRSLSSS